MSNNKYTILIVEDETNILSFVETVLEANSYQIISAGTGVMGKSMFMSYNPDLIILDLGLPDMDGMEVIKTIRQDSAVPIIVLSARADERDKVMALDLGANDYVTKPFGTEELLARVRAALRNTNAKITPKNISTVSTRHTGLLAFSYHLLLHLLQILHHIFSSGRSRTFIINASAKPIRKGMKISIIFLRRFIRISLLLSPRYKTIAKVISIMG